jgi:acyl-CoA reductase-like NAD-dependent aldehyde dehydrogenase
MPRRPLAQQRALRALAEGAKATLDLLADASGRSLKMLRRDAESEGWALDRAPQEDVAARVRAIAAMLLDHIEAMGRAALEEGRKISKSDVDTALALVRSLEKIGEVMRPEEAAKENQIREDEQLAAVLERMDERIIELARELAAQMVAEACGPGRSVAGKE